MVEGAALSVGTAGEREVLLRVRPDRDMGCRPGHFLTSAPPLSKERPHPFTVADVGLLEIGIKAVGAGTRRLVDNAAVGERVHLSAPQGNLDEYFSQRGSNVWVVGGAGIAPMLAGVRGLPETGPEARLSVLWSRRSGEETETVNELRDVAARHKLFSLDLVDTRTQPRISTASILAAGGVGPKDTYVRLCGPYAMVMSLLEGLRTAGVPDDNIRIESFSFR